MFARNCFNLLIISFCFATKPLLLDSKPVSPARPAALLQTEDVFSRGVQAYNARDYAKAEKLLSAYLQENPTSLIRDVGLLWYGRTLIGLNRLSEAEKVAETLEKEFPKSPITRQLRSELGRAASRQKAAQVAKVPAKKQRAETVKPPADQKALAKEGAKKKEISKVAEPPRPLQKSKPAEKTSKPAAVATVKQTPPTPETKQTAELRKEKSATEVRRPAEKKSVAKEPAAPKETAAPPVSEKEVKPKEVAQSEKPKKPRSEKQATPALPKMETKPALTTEAVSGKQPAVPKESAVKPPTRVPGPKEKAKPTEVAQAIKPAAPLGGKPVEPKKTAPPSTAAFPTQAPRSVEAKKMKGTPAAPPKEKPAGEAQTAKASVAPKKKKARETRVLPTKIPTYTAENQRDPFRPLVVRSSEEPPENLPLGKKGLLVLRLQLKGIVMAGNQRLALVESGTNPAAIFLYERDSVYDGVVEKILEDRIVFSHFGMDKLGKPYQEEVIKKLSGSGMF